MKYSVLLLSLVSNIAGAESCNDAMSQFSKVSSLKTKSICNFFKDPVSFTEFKGCILSTVKKFKRTATDDDIFALSEKELSGVLSLCGAPNETTSNIRVEPKTNSGVAR